MKSKAMPLKQFIAATLLGGVMMVSTPAATALAADTLLLDDLKPKAVKQKGSTAVIDLFGDQSLLLKVTRDGNSVFISEDGKEYQFDVRSMGSFRLNRGDNRLKIDRPGDKVFIVSDGDDVFTIDVRDYLRGDDDIKVFKGQRGWENNKNGGLSFQDDDGNSFFMGWNSDKNETSWDFKFEQDSKYHEEMLEELEEAMEDIEDELEDAETTLERKALKQALKSLEASRREIQRNWRHGRKRGERVVIDLDEVMDVEIERALREVNKHTIELRFLSEELREELDEARDEVRDALQDLEVRITSDEGKGLQIRLQKEAEDALGELEERQLETLRRAEEELKRARERLERKIEAKKAKPKDKKKSKDDADD